MHLLFLFFILSVSQNIEAQNFNVIENVWIPISDGTKLAARVWLPEEINNQQVPAILEYIPYRKRDGTRIRDESLYNWFARVGYACIRVDMRGSGDSEGFLEDEYLKIEQADALEVIDWIAKQSWCTGSVGMIGKSWGGFNALQVAALRPSALKAIITVCSTDDRYEDIHFSNGCLLTDNLWWGSIMLAYQARPLTPEISGDKWRKKWLERINKMPFWPALWMKHPHRDSYWKHGSICEDWNAIECPVFAIGGWADAYTNAIFRMLENIKAPCIGLIGPWAHLYPHNGLPGPAIGFLQEAKRWWDQWLKKENTGIMNSPKVRAYIEEWSAPSSWRDPAPGHWVGENSWPSNNIKSQMLFLTLEGLKCSSTKVTELSICSPQWTGFTSGEWLAEGVPGEMPPDQRPDDGCSLIFDSEPLIHKIETLGFPELVLNISSDKQVANMCIRLCDVSPDGSSRRISYQVLNLTHRDSHEFPEVLKPNEFYKVKVKLNSCGYVFESDHRIRIAISTVYWPLIWPAPENTTLTLRTDISALNLPVRKPLEIDKLISFESPVSGKTGDITKIAPGNLERYFTINFSTNKAKYITNGIGSIFGEGIFKLNGINTILSHDLKRKLTIEGNDPLSARNIIKQSCKVEREDGVFVIKTNLEMQSTGVDFILTGTLVIYENDTLVASRIFNEAISRHHL